MWHQSRRAWLEAKLAQCMWIRQPVGEAHKDNDLEHLHKEMLAGSSVKGIGLVMLVQIYCTKAGFDSLNEMQLSF